MEHFKILWIDDDWNESSTHYDDLDTLRNSLES
jgi:hypothetical protein